MVKPCPQSLVSVVLCRVSCLLSSCLHVEPNLETSQNVRNSIKKLIELSGGQGEIDLIIGVVILKYLQDTRYFTIKGKNLHLVFIG